MFHVFILTSHELKRQNVEKFRELESRYGCEITFVNVEDSFLRKFHFNQVLQLPLQTFYRLYAAELLPETVNRVLYLDCDIVVTGDLSQLWSVDLTDKAVAVVQDYWSYATPDDNPNRLQYPVEAGYFNAGVVLINLDWWRKNNAGAMFFAFIEKNHEIMDYLDQDVMNALLWDKKIYLPLTYNFQLLFLSKNLLNSLPSETKKEVLDTLHSQPVIIHFASCWKPWSVVYYGLPFRNLWIQYKKMSPWPHIKETVPRRKSINWLIKRYILWPTGIMKPGKNHIQF